MKQVILWKLQNDTIAAIATALSDSGIGIIRISGDDAIYIVDSIFRSPSGKRILTKVQSHTVHYGYIVDKEENVIDEVMVVVMKAPKVIPRKIPWRLTVMAVYW